MSTRSIVTPSSPSSQTQAGRIAQIPEDLQLDIWFSTKEHSLEQRQWCLYLSQCPLKRLNTWVPALALGLPPTLVWSSRGLALPRHTQMEICLTTPPVFMIDNADCLESQTHTAEHVTSSTTSTTCMSSKVKNAASTSCIGSRECTTFQYTSKNSKFCKNWPHLHKIS